MLKKEYTIDADKWICGDEASPKGCSLGEGFTEMKNKQGYMCCLGQIMRQQGVVDDDLESCGDPRDVRYEIMRHSKVAYKNKADLLTRNFLFDNKGRNSHLATSAMEINDDPSTTIGEKVNKLKGLFSRKGIKLRFKNIKKHL